MKSIVQIGLIIIAVMFVMKMMKGGKRCEGFTQQQPQKVACNCNISRENFADTVEGLMDGIFKPPPKTKTADQLFMELPAGLRPRGPTSCEQCGNILRLKKKLKEDSDADYSDNESGGNGN